MACDCVKMRTCLIGQPATLGTKLRCFIMGGSMDGQVSDGGAARGNLGEPRARAGQSGRRPCNLSSSHKVLLDCHER